MFETIKNFIENANKKIFLVVLAIFLIVGILAIAFLFLKRGEEKSAPKPPITVNEDPCAQEKTEEERQKCLDKIKVRNIVEKEKNIKKCLEIETIELRDDCIKALAAYKGLNTNNDDLCLAISDKMKRKLCVDRVVINTRDPKFCEKHFEGEPFEELECKDRISAFELGETTNQENVYKCMDITSLEYPTLCLWKSFKEKFDNNCDNVPAEFRDYCVAYYTILDAETEEECSKIPLENYKKFCLIKVEKGGWEGIANLDSDKDGLTDWNELFIGIDPYNPDSDGDGLSDGDEMAIYGINPKSKDTDSDGLSDYEEVKKYRTNPNKSDCDNDGILDGEEIKMGTNPTDGDIDRDGLPDVIEKKFGTDPYKTDTDNDGMSDLEEYKNGFDPLNPENDLVDSDGDGLLDIDEIFYGTDRFNPDTDGDGIGDKEEIDNLTNPSGSGDLDFDGDGISDKEEEKYKTNFCSSDTDSDGLNDYEEIFTYKTNPKIKDTDGDGLYDYEEIFIYKTNPNDSDTDNDGYLDGEEVKGGYNPLGSGRLER